MVRTAAWLLAATLSTWGAAAQGGRVPPPELKLEAIRLYRGDGTTSVKALLEIPHALLTVGEDKLYHYQVAVRIMDSTGLVLAQQTWAQSAQSVQGATGTASLETMDFPVRPGSYQIMVDVSDQQPGGGKFTAHCAVEGYPTRPIASDLVLSPSIRAADPKETARRTGEWWYGNVVIALTPELRIPANQPQLYYLLEAYTGAKDSGDVALQIRDSTGRVLVKTRPKPVTVDSGGALVTGGLNLGGIPPGTYQVDVTLRVGGDTENRTGSFVVREAPVAVAVQDGRVSDEAYFAEMGEAQLDSAEAPLIYLAESGELSVFNKEMSTPAKARFLTAFWQKRDPTPETPDNPAREAFYGRIAEANKLYREAGRATVPGWRTDRGRIFLKFGKPDVVWQRPEENQILPLEVWRFTRNRDRYFIFLSRNRIGAFNLLYSNELTEPGQPDWRDQLGQYGVEAVEQYLGVRLGRRGGL